MHESRKEKLETFERMLRSFQRLSFILAYPALLSLVAASMAITYPDLTPSMSLGATAALSVYVAANPMTAKPLYDGLILVAIGVAILAGYAFLSMRLVKNHEKAWPIYVGLGVYAADTVFLAISAIPNLPWHFLDWRYYLNLGIHVIFFVLYGLLIRSHIKLTRYEKELLGE